MSCLPFMKRGVGPHRVAAVILLLAVFFLPLHSHSFTPTAQVTKECSCYHGGRTQAGLAPALADWTPSLQASLIVAYEPQVLGWLSIKSHTIRAPPSASSL